MKKILALVLLMAMLLSLSACGGGKAKNSGGNPEENVIEHTGKKIKGEITAASVFYNGLAFVCLDGNEEKSYCIDKRGNIVFELENQIQPLMAMFPVKFENGYALIDGGICNTKGKITYPKDVGATEFFDIALKGGYIIATKETADYSTAKQEAGVMNTDFEWVVQPSEAIYNELSEDIGTTIPLNTQSFYANEVVFFENCKKYLNVKTGEVSDKANIKIPSENWIYYDDHTFKNDSEEIMVDLSKLDNIESTGGKSYKNGKVPVIFLNQQVGKRFWTLVDEKGKFLFEPVEMLNFSDFMLVSIEFDGENTVFYDPAMKKLSSFNSKGELLGELSDVDSSTVYIGDGIILVISHSVHSSKYRYYNPDFSPLF